MSSTSDKAKGKLNQAAATLLILFGVFLAGEAAAGWLVINNLTVPRDIVTNASRTFSFANPLPGYGGTVTMTHADLADGSVDTAAFLDSYDFNLNTNKNLGNPSLGGINGFTAAGLNPVGLNSIGFGSTDLTCKTTPCQKGSASLDFSSLGAGFLPAGTLLLIDDIDGPDSMSNLRADGTSGQVTTPWLSLFKRFDADGPQFSPKQPDPLLGDYSPYTITNGIYNFPATGRQTDAPTFWFYTNQNISQMSMDFGVNDPSRRGFLMFMAGPDVAIPEPAPWALLGLGLAALCFSRGKQKNQRGKKNLISLAS